MRALTQSQAPMTSALLEWCGRDWWSWVCQEVLAFTAQSWWTKPDCAPWPNPPSSYWPSNHGRNRERERECYKHKKTCWGEPKWAEIEMERKGREQERERQILSLWLFCMHVTQITGNGFKGFFPVRFTLIPPLSLHLTELMSRSSQTTNITFPGHPLFCSEIELLLFSHYDIIILP